MDVFVVPDSDEHDSNELPDSRHDYQHLPHSAHISPARDSRIHTWVSDQYYRFSLTPASPTASPHAHQSKSSSLSSVSALSSGGASTSDSSVHSLRPGSYASQRDGNASLVMRADSPLLGFDASSGLTDDPLQFPSPDYARDLSPLQDAQSDAAHWVGVLGDEKHLQITPTPSPAPTPPAPATPPTQHTTHARSRSQSVASRALPSPGSSPRQRISSGPHSQSRMHSISSTLSFETSPSPSNEPLPLPPAVIPGLHKRASALSLRKQTSALSLRRGVVGGGDTSSLSSPLPGAGFTFPSAVPSYPSSFYSTSSSGTGGIGGSHSPKVSISRSPSIGAELLSSVSGIATPDSNRNAVYIDDSEDVGERLGALLLAAANAASSSSSSASSHSSHSPSPSTSGLMMPMGVYALREEDEDEKQAQGQEQPRGQQPYQPVMESHSHVYAHAQSTGSQVYLGPSVLSSPSTPTTTPPSTYTTPKTSPTTSSTSFTLSRSKLSLPLAAEIEHELEEGETVPVPPGSYFQLYGHRSSLSQGSTFSSAASTPIPDVRVYGPRSGSVGIASPLRDSSFTLSSTYDETDEEEDYEYYGDDDGRHHEDKGRLDEQGSASRSPSFAVPRAAGGNLALPPMCRSRWSLSSSLEEERGRNAQDSGSRDISSLLVSPASHLRRSKKKKHRESRKRESLEARDVHLHHYHNHHSLPKSASTSNLKRYSRSIVNGSIGLGGKLLVGAGNLAGSDASASEKVTGSAVGGGSGGKRKRLVSFIAKLAGGSGSGAGATSTYSLAAGPDFHSLPTVISTPMSAFGDEPMATRDGPAQLTQSQVAQEKELPLIRRSSTGSSSSRSSPPPLPPPKDVGSPVSRSASVLGVSVGVLPPIPASPPASPMMPSHPENDNERDKSMPASPRVEAATESQASTNNSTTVKPNDAPSTTPRRMRARAGSVPLPRSAPPSVTLPPLPPTSLLPAPVLLSSFPLPPDSMPIRTRARSGSASAVLELGFVPSRSVPPVPPLPLSPNRPQVLGTELAKARSLPDGITVGSRTIAGVLQGEWTPATVHASASPSTPMTLERAFSPASTVKPSSPLASPSRTQFQLQGSPPSSPRAPSLHPSTSTPQLVPSSQRMRSVSDAAPLIRSRGDERKMIGRLSIGGPGIRMRGLVDNARSWLAGTPSTPSSTRRNSHDSAHETPISSPTSATFSIPSASSSLSLALKPFTTKSSPPSVVTPSSGSSPRAGSPLPFTSLHASKKSSKGKRRLVISGIGEDERGLCYEAVKSWCEGFGEIREIKKRGHGCLEVDFKKASVAETVCRVQAQVYIRGAGSVNLSWYTKNKK